jgi:hypothetical protein
MSDTFVILHPDHGEAVCDESQFDSFSAAGWKRRDKAPRKARTVTAADLADRDALLADREQQLAALSAQNASLTNALTELQAELDAIKAPALSSDQIDSAHSV